MNADIIILPVVRSLNAEPAPVIKKKITKHRKLATEIDIIRSFNDARAGLNEKKLTQTRRIAVELSTTPENWKRLERMAWDQRCSVGDVMAGMVVKNLEETAT